MKKVYNRPITYRTTYNTMILDVNPGTNNGGDYNGGDVDARERNDFEDEYGCLEGIDIKDNWHEGLW